MFASYFKKAFIAVKIYLFKFNEWNTAQICEAYIQKCYKKACRIVISK